MIIHAVWMHGLNDLVIVSYCVAYMVCQGSQVQKVGSAGPTGPQYRWNPTWARAPETPLTPSPWNEWMSMSYRLLLLYCQQYGPIGVVLKTIRDTVVRRLYYYLLPHRIIRNNTSRKILCPCLVFFFLTWPIGALSVLTTPRDDILLSEDFNTTHS